MIEAEQAFMLALVSLIWIGTTAADQPGGYLQLFGRSRPLDFQALLLRDQILDVETELNSFCDFQVHARAGRQDRARLHEGFFRHPVSRLLGPPV